MQHRESVFNFLQCENKIKWELIQIYFMQTFCQLTPQTSDNLSLYVTWNAF